MVVETKTRTCWDTPRRRNVCDETPNKIVYSNDIYIDSGAINVKRKRKLKYMLDVSRNVTEINENGENEQTRSHRVFKNLDRPV